MDTERMLIAAGLAVTLLIGGGAVMMLGSNDSLDSDDTSGMVDPLMQDEGHAHRTASQPVLFTDNIHPVSFTELPAPGNAEIHVAATLQYRKSTLSMEGD